MGQTTIRMRAAELLVGVDLCDETVGAATIGATTRPARVYCGRDAVNALVDSTGRTRTLCASHSRRVQSVFADALRFDSEAF